MKTKFYLRKGSKKSTINFEFRDGVITKWRASTGFVINNEKDWDENKQKMKLPSSTINAKLINSKLSEIESEIDKLRFQIEDGGITIGLVKEIFNKVFGKKVEEGTKFKKNKFDIKHINDSTKNDFIKYFDWVLTFYSTNPTPYSQEVLTVGTLKTMKNARIVLCKFLKKNNYDSLTFNDINRDFYFQFVEYLYNKNYSKNYIGTIIQKIKTIMTYSFDDGKHNNTEFKKKYFSKITEVVNFPYLDTAELKKIEEVVLKDNEADLARDIFLILCNTGLRISDFLNHVKNPVYVVEKGKKFMLIKQMKTGNTVYIPHSATVKRVIDKRGGKLPEYLHQNIINKQLKSICKKAKINSVYQYSRTEGGKKVIYNEPKYKFISTHTGRRSFCTNAYIAEVPVHDIMVISGHKTERVFLDYIKVDGLKNASRIANNEFFN